MELMRSEAVENEQKDASVNLIEHEYQTLTWEQSSFADGKSHQPAGGSRKVHRPAFTAGPESPYRIGTA